MISLMQRKPRSSVIKMFSRIELSVDLEPRENEEEEEKSQQVSKNF